MKHITIHTLHFLWPLMLLAACADGGFDTTDTLSGDGVKTPLAVTALLDASTPSVKSRAADKTFADGDQMVAYLRHVTWNGGFTTAEADKRTPVTADQAPRLVTFTATDSKAWSSNIIDIYPFDNAKNIAINSENTQQAANLTASYTSTSSATVGALYWDDFSSSASEATDLRTDGHYLQSYYGYCFNGGTPSTPLGTDDAHKVEDGIIGWTIETDQSGTVAPTNFQKSDLLWSAEQTPVSYAHSDKVDGNRPGLVIPYTHAMSKVTINVTAGTGFAADFAFTDTKLVLNHVRTACTATAPTAKLTYPTDGTGRDDVTMKVGSGTGTRAFSAIIVPSILTVGNTLATITRMDGNTYTIPVTEAMVKNDDGWGSQLGIADEDVNSGTAQSPHRARPHRADDPRIPSGKGFQMKSGVHYVLNVTINNTEVNVSADIVDWDEIEAEGVGEIHFSHDIKDKDSIAEALRDNGFEVYKSSSTSFGTKATTLSWNKASATWKYKPVIYWQGGGAEYFRALSNVRADAAGTAANESLLMENELDALWGTTAAHSGKYADDTPYDFAEGAALNPRTGDVPLQFYHAMSKITFNLVDALKDNADPLARLNLHNATIQLTDLATGGTLNLADGTTTPSAITAGQKTFSEDAGSVPSRMGYFPAAENGVTTAYDPDFTLKDYVITPQTITDKATVIITLADGSVYKAQLNKCTQEVIVNGNATYPVVTQWERGKHYTYTITLSKETITFRAMIKDWDSVTGSGNATLEWD